MNICKNKLKFRKIIHIVENINLTVDEDERREVNREREESDLWLSKWAEILEMNSK